MTSAPDKTKPALSVEPSAAPFVPQMVRIGTINHTNATCITNPDVYHFIDNTIAELVNGHVVLEGGKRLIELVFEAYGYGHYVTNDYYSLCYIDGDPLNCTVENITVLKNK